MMFILTLTAFVYGIIYPVVCEIGESVRIEKSGELTLSSILYMKSVVTHT